MSNIIEEYLVSLGFSTDEPSFNKLKNVMSEAEKSVVDHSFGMARHVVEAQAAITGAFFSVSAAIVGVVDKVAMADQNYRLMGLRMMTTTETARKMDMITKALGVSLEEIVWDPSGELQKRARDMGDEIDRLNTMLGGDFKKNMRGVRDLRAEFSMLGIDLEYLGMKFSSDLFKGLTGQADPLVWMKEKVAWFEEHIPEFSAKLVQYAVPALQETWKIAQDLGEVLKAGGVAFVNIVGLLSGDTSIQGASLDFDKMATAIGHVAHGFESLLGWITQAELLLAHFASGMSLALTGKFDAALKEFKAGIAELTTGSGAALGLIFGPEGALIGGALGGAAELARKGKLGATAQQQLGQPTTGTESTAGPFGFISPDIAAVGTDAVQAAQKKLKEQVDTSLGGTVKFFAGAVVDELSTYWDYFHRETGSQVEPINQKQLQEERNKALKKWANPGMATPETQAAPQAAYHPELPASPSRLDIQQALRAAAAQYAIPPELALAVAKHESGFNPLAKNLNRDKYGNVISTDWGVMQLNDQTLKTFGLSEQDAVNPTKNIDAGVRLLSQLMQHYHGDQTKALAAYSAGQGRIDKTPEFDQWPEVTRKAVPEILQMEKQFTDSGAVAGAINKPSWYGVAPDFMKESPVWYGVAPSWLTKTPEGDSGKPVVAPTAWANPVVSPDLRARMDDMQRPVTATANNTSVNHTIDLGGITVYVTNPGASADQIARTVQEHVRDAMDTQTRNDLTMLQPQY
jgi:hypothetical protein